MEKDQKILDEQQAPLKNSDNAFVQVGKNGEPVIPETAERNEDRAEERERTTTPDKR